MITIVKGSSKLVVTKGTYEEQYKKLGYSIASDKKEATKKVASSDNIKVNKEENLDKLIEKDNQEKENLSEKYGFIKTKKEASISKKGNK